mmetsp:Transcript_17648/g.37473  ORF Transcript_17648/g.37473 Transcript_17648/m.37473 type:complete len:421 (+) Transcript_17648:188-1450(+)
MLPEPLLISSSTWDMRPKNSKKSSCPLWSSSTSSTSRWIFAAGRRQPISCSARSTSAWPKTPVPFWRLSNASRNAYIVSALKPNSSARSRSDMRCICESFSQIRCTMRSSSSKSNWPEPSLSTSSMSWAMLCCSCGVLGLRPKSPKTWQVSLMSSSPLWSWSYVAKIACTSSDLSSMFFVRMIRITSRNCPKPTSSISSPQTCNACIISSTSSLWSLTPSSAGVFSKPKSASKRTISSTERLPLPSTSFSVNLSQKSRSWLRNSLKVFQSNACWAWSSRSFRRRMLSDFSRIPEMRNSVRSGLTRPLPSGVSAKTTASRSAISLSVGGKSSMSSSNVRTWSTDMNPSSSVSTRTQAWMKLECRARRILPRASSTMVQKSPKPIVAFPSKRSKTWLNCIFSVRVRPMIPKSANASMIFSSL